MYIHTCTHICIHTVTHTVPTYTCMDVHTYTTFSTVLTIALHVQTQIGSLVRVLKVVHHSPTPLSPPLCTYNTEVHHSPTPLSPPLCTYNTEVHHSPTPLSPPLCTYNTEVHHSPTPLSPPLCTYNTEVHHSPTPLSPPLCTYNTEVHHSPTPLSPPLCTYNTEGTSQGVRFPGDMAKNFGVHLRRKLKLAVLLTVEGKYFMVPFPTMKTTDYVPLKKYLLCTVCGTNAQCIPTRWSWWGKRSKENWLAKALQTTFDQLCSTLAIKESALQHTYNQVVKKPWQTINFISLDLLPLHKITGQHIGQIH